MMAICGWNVSLVN